MLNRNPQQCVISICLYIYNSKTWEREKESPVLEVLSQKKKSTALPVDYFFCSAWRTWSLARFLWELISVTATVGISEEKLLCASWQLLCNPGTFVVNRKTEFCLLHQTWCWAGANSTRGSWSSTRAGQRNAGWSACSRNVEILLTKLCPFDTKFAYLN